MKNSLLLKSLFFSFAFFFSFKSFAQQVKINEELLYGCWTDSPAEHDSVSGVLTFRPCSSQVSAEEFMPAIEIKPNGQCSRHQIASNDGHVVKEGSWSFDKANNILETKEEKEGPITRFKLI
ncbi:MAG: hypothetical protein JNL60_04550, partial [Bacteroidia bacterium]|nr:hypothetical protein [Bacteroidia bacterium]